MNRRTFFEVMIGGLATNAAVRTWPFRVYSFPSGVKPIIGGVLTPEMLRRALQIMKEARVPQGPVVYWIHPRDEKRLKEMFRDYDFCAAGT